MSNPGTKWYVDLCGKRTLCEYVDVNRVRAEQAFGAISGMIKSTSGNWIIAKEGNEGFQKVGTCVLF